jgi:hypothetical protein
MTTLSAVNSSPSSVRNVYRPSACVGPNLVWLAYTRTLGRPRLYRSPPAAIGSMRLSKTRSTMSDHRTLSIVESMPYRALCRMVSATSAA